MGPGPATLHDYLMARVGTPNVDSVGKPKAKPCCGRAHPDAVPKEAVPWLRDREVWLMLGRW